LIEKQKFEEIEKTSRPAIFKIFILPGKSIKMACTAWSATLKTG